MSIEIKYVSPCKTVIRNIDLLSETDAQNILERQITKHLQVLDCKYKRDQIELDVQDFNALIRYDSGYEIHLTIIS